MSKIITTIVSALIIIAAFLFAFDKWLSLQRSEQYARCIREAVHINPNDFNLSLALLPIIACGNIAPDLYEKDRTTFTALRNKSEGEQSNKDSTKKSLSK